MIYWLFGLSGSGKTTLAEAASESLKKRGEAVVRIDGDLLRGGLCSDLGFSRKDRLENLRRASELAKIVHQNGVLAICSFITPTLQDRALVREILKDSVKLVWIRKSLQACERNDVKGLYKKAREGKIPEFTGISAPFDEGDDADWTLDTEGVDLECSIQSLLAFISKGDL